MTGAGQGRGGQAGGRGPRRDTRTRERGTDRYQRGRGEDPLDTAPRAPGATLVELRSVSLPVAPRRGARLGLGGTVVVVLIVGLLAAGFGVLGGRPSPSPSPPLVGVVPTAPLATPADGAPTPIVATPAVTPFSPCAAAPTTVLEVLLQVNGRPTPGVVDVLEWHVASPAPEPTRSSQAPPDRVSVPVDVITELWIVGGACAISWDVGLSGSGSLQTFLNPEREPGLAAQNRFYLALAPYAGRDLDLYANLVFPTLNVRATWPITVEPFERPIAGIQNENDPGSIVEGCDVAVVLGNGYVYPRDPACTDDLPFEPGVVIEVERGEQLEFGLGDWDVSNGVLVCGHLSGRSFVAEPKPGCNLEATGRSSPGTHIEFQELPADLEEGAWTLAISACAFSGGIGPTNSICGTWYANVLVGS